MASAKTGRRAQLRALHREMSELDLDHRQMAAEFARRFNLHPRAAWRHAHGWSLREAARRINQFRAEAGLDPGGLASMTAAHLCEHENWPGQGTKPAGRKPGPALLAVLARVYGCGVIDLLDLDDHRHLPPADLLLLGAGRQFDPGSTESGDGAGTNQLALMARPRGPRRQEGISA